MEDMRDDEEGDDYGGEPFVEAHDDEYSQDPINESEEGKLGITTNKAKSSIINEMTASIKSSTLDSSLKAKK